MLGIRFSSTLAGVVLLTACGGTNGLDPSSPGATHPICQGDQCCTAEQLVCRGNPDGSMVCTCYRDWTCDSALSPKKCTQNPVDTPSGTADWKCVVQEGKDVCTSTSATGVPTGKNGWVCTQTSAGVRCERPVNTPDGGSAWNCSYSGDEKICNATATPPPTPPPGGATWTCTKDDIGNQVCTKTGEGMPPGGGNWMCYWKNGTITCEGSSPTPPGGSGWTCEENEFVGGYRCTTPVESGDKPGGGGTWTCTSGSEFGGISCTQAPPVKSGEECVPGQKMWCDGAVYCSYGQVVCGPDGNWKRNDNGDLDCMELPSGERPNTVCACYFFYFNKACCETPDCIVPPGTSGQICPASKGQYCDYCTPQNSECQTGKCIVTSKNETFCGQSCGSGGACPAGSTCTSLDGSHQCVPTDGSCYF